MGFLDFLRSKKAVSIKFSEIDSWLNKQVENKHLDLRINKAKAVINDLIQTTRKGLDNLEKASLINNNIPVKEKQIMEGHRKTYITRINRFLEDINVPDDFASIGHYAARFSESLDSLSEETHKNYLVLKHFMESELAHVIRTVKSIEDELMKLQSDIDREGIELIKDAKIRLNHYKSDMGKRDDLKLQKIEKENELDLIIKKKEKLETRIDELKQSKDYAEFKVFIDEKNRQEEEINSIEQELISIFAELNRPLKKFTHNTPHENFVDKYIADPAGALEYDNSLLIHDILLHMSRELETLELKDKQLEKAENMLRKLSKEYLIKKKIDLERLKQANKDLATKINRSVAALNLSETESWTKSIDNKIRQAKAEIEGIGKEIEEINTDYLKQKVKEKIKEIAEHIKILDE